MKTAGQNPSGPRQSAGTSDPLLAEAMALTCQEYREAFSEVKDDSRADQIRASAERISRAIRSDPRLAPFAGRPEFVEWAVREVADDSEKSLSAVSAEEARTSLEAPRLKLLANLLRVLEGHAKSSPAYVRRPLEAVLDDPRPWTGDPRPWTGPVGQFAAAAVGDLHVAHRLDVDILSKATEYGLKPFDMLAVFKRARSRAIDDPAWYTAKDQAAHDEMLKEALASGLAGGERAEATAAAGSGMAGCGPSACAVSAVRLVPALPREMGWAQQTDPCNSMEYLRYLVYTHAIGETGQLFQAGELLADRWAQATNWCRPEEAGELAELADQGAANCQGFDDLIYWLRRRNARTDTAYATRTEIYQQQLENPALQQAWGNFISQVQGYLSAPCTRGTTPSYRCLGIYTAAEALRRVVAAQLTGLARMQIKDLASSLQLAWRLFTDPCVIGIINPVAAGSQPPGGTAGYAGYDPADQAVTVFGVIQQLLGSQASGLFQAWDRAMLLDQVFDWVQNGPEWDPYRGCEDDDQFVRLLGAVSALLPGAGPAALSASAALTVGTA